MLTTGQLLVLIGALILGTAIPRFLPFAIFAGNKESHPFIRYLGEALPYAMIGFLVVYCLKGVRLDAFPFGLPEFLGVALVAALHWWKGNALLSIGAGTAFYMVLVQAVFV
jgi:branched-subunit amino acid transport protein AzlD